MKIKGVFKKIKNCGETFYGFVTEDCSIRESGIEIEEFVGKHLEGKSHKNVEILWFCNTVVEYFPRGLHKIFPRLKVLKISDCDLKEITRKDLKGLEDLEDLCLDTNELKTLPSDLFTGMTKLKWISFADNKLELDSLSSEVLRPILANEPEFIDFSSDANTDLIYQGNSIESLIEFMESIDQASGNSEAKQEQEEDLEALEESTDEETSTKPFDKNLIKQFKSLWSSRDFSDLTIIAGDEESEESKQFAVHKLALGIQSSVFASIFKNNMKHSATMKIKGFSAETVEAMLHFIYTGEVQEECNATKLYEIAAKYKIDELKEVAEKMVLRTVDDSNALEVLKLGNSNDSVKLKRKSFDAIKGMCPELSLTEELMNKPENLEGIVEACRKRQQEIEESEKNYQAKIQKFL